MASLASIFFPVDAFQPQEEELFTFEKMMKSFAAHERNERRFVEEYSDFANQHENPLIRFLLQMIMADEEKHHAVVHTITASLGSDLSWQPTHEGLPKLGQISAEEKEALLKLTADFIQTEKDGIEEYKALLKPSANCYGGLLVLLIQTIIHDSEKHLMILRFIDEKLREG